MKKINNINDPLIAFLQKEFEYVEGFSNRKKIASYLKDLFEQDKYLQFILDHFRFSEAKDRNFMTRESFFHFDEEGNFITEDESRSYLCLPPEVKMKLREEQADKDLMEQ